MKAFAYYWNKAIRHDGHHHHPPSYYGVGDEEPKEQQGKGVEESKDWSLYYVNYTSLKAKVSELAQRRTTFHQLLLWQQLQQQQQDDDEGLTAPGKQAWNQILAELYPPPPQTNTDHRPSTTTYDTKTTNHHHNDDKMPTSRSSLDCTEACFPGDQTTDYFVFVDDDDDQPATLRRCWSTPPIMSQQVIRDPRDAIHRLTQLERNEFSNALEREIISCSNFYTRQLAAIRRTLEKKEDQNETSLAPIHDQSPVNGLAAVGNELLEVFAFEVVNILAIRQIMMRYDAFVRTVEGAHLSEWQLQQHFQQIKKKQQQRMYDSNNNNNHSSAVVTTGEEFDNLFSLAEWHELQSMFVTKYRAAGLNSQERLSYLLEFEAQSKEFQSVLAKSAQSVERAAEGHIAMRDSFVAWFLKLRQYLVVGSMSKAFVSLYSPSLWTQQQQQDGQEQEQQQQMQGRNLKPEIKAMAKWRSAKNNALSMTSFEEDNHSDHGSDLSQQESSSDQLDPQNVQPLILNLISCFLFMCNNYVIEPSSAYYANALGVNDALSGLMIGMAAWFAMTAAIAYSFWTNRSYTQPIIFAAILMVIGNWMYANAYTYRSIELCLLGRAIQGLGAPRMINRRYVADATPFCLRTAASAAFATMTALGAALGPGLAIILDSITEFSFHVPLVGQQTFNGMTGPGYFMALAWSVYLVAVLLFFREPKRSGLEELRRREAAEGGHLLEEEEGKEKVKVSSVKNLNGIPEDDQDDTHSVDSFTDQHGANLYQFLSSRTNIRGTNASSSWWRCGCCDCISHITRAVVLCMFLILLKRIALESIVGSTSIVTKNRYGWSIQNVGTLHLVNGVIVIPVTILAGYLSRFYEDRHLALWFLSITLFGMLFLIDISDLNSTLMHEENDGYNQGRWFAVGPARYIFGSLIAFSGIEACESYIASLMTKVTPSSLASGTFNSGLLTTLVGTGGRALGDLFITLMGLISIRHLLNLLIIPGALLVLLSIVLIRYNYSILAV
ncbi:hypothetical protein ACA910_018066 [Epithemia clementina (nom. ined.)]